MKKNIFTVSLLCLSFGVASTWANPNPTTAPTKDTQSVQKKTLIQKSMNSKANRNEDSVKQRTSGKIPVQTVTKNPKKLEYLRQNPSARQGRVIVPPSSNPKKAQYQKIDARKKHPNATLNDRVNGQDNDAKKKYYYKRLGQNGLGAVANTRKGGPKKSQTTDPKKAAYNKNFYSSKKGQAFLESIKQPHAKAGKKRTVQAPALN